MFIEQIASPVVLLEVNFLSFLSFLKFFFLELSSVFFMFWTKCSLEFRIIEYGPQTKSNKKKEG